MDRRRNRKHSNNWNNQKRNEQRERENRQKSFQFNKALYEDQDAEKQRLAAIADVTVLLLISLPVHLYTLTVCLIR